MKAGDSTKRHEKAGRKPAFLAAPEKLVDLLYLVNLLPVECRNPDWARRKKMNMQPSKFSFWESEILHWESFQFGYEGLWGCLSSAIPELPLTLQAFILRDSTGDMVDLGDGTLAHLYPGDSDLQAMENFQLLGKGEQELKEIVQSSLDKLYKAFQRETELRTNPPLMVMPSPLVPAWIITRIRDRLIFVLAAQELLSCLTHPDKEKQINESEIYHLSDATKARLYISDGKLALWPPILFSRLEGIEVSRIRECPVCYKIFWAGRKDMLSCSPKCAHIVRSRKYRRAYKEKYAFQRYQKETEAKKPQPRQGQTQNDTETKSSIKERK